MYYVQIQLGIYEKGCNTDKKLIFFKKKVATLSLKIAVTLIL
jgi:hypothetical protein